MINRYLKNYIEQLDDEKLNFDLRNGLSTKRFFSENIFDYFFRTCHLGKSSSQTRSIGLKFFSHNSRD
jgi:hypothetical protein